MDNETNNLEDNNEDFTNYITKELAGTKTEKNITEAFCGESKARNRYTFFAKTAKEEGFVHIGKIFEETAENELMHGKIWFKLLNGGKIPNTLENLESAARVENYEWEDMYKKFAQDAREEGFERIACLFETIRDIEKMHMTRYEKLIKDVKTNTVFETPEEIVWECAKCGCNVKGTKAPEKCPFCRHPKAYFFEKCYNY